MNANKEGLTIIVKYKKITRIAILMLLAISMPGPWMFDLINVPAEFTCSEPHVRLYGDFCGLPLSGFEFFKLFVGGFFYMLFTLTTGSFLNDPRELLVGLPILSLIPFITSLLLIWKREPRRLSTINLVAWILALIPTLFMFVFMVVQRNGYVLRLWGLWLYVSVAISAVVIESFMMKNGKLRTIEE
ncbi:MAG: hypothetical protein R3307_01195 [Anaerolineales bacterium]|nr:hypothetical protein [Anaerolineales bacterium]